MWYKFKNANINLNNVSIFRKSREGASFRIEFKYVGVNEWNYNEYSSEEDRDRVFNDLINTLEEPKVVGLTEETGLKKETNMIKSTIEDVKQMAKEHKNVLYTVAIIFLLDHFIFDGAFRDKLKEMMNSLIGKVQKKLDEPK